MQKNSAIPAKNWHRAEIIAELKKKGWSLRHLSITVGLSPNTLYTALKVPYPKAERVIAAALDIAPETIWPERYAARRFRPALTK